MEEAEQIKNILEKEQNYFKEEYDLEVHVHSARKHGYKSLDEFMTKGSSILLPREYSDKCRKCGGEVVTTKKGIECSNCYTRYYLKETVLKRTYEYWTFLMILNHIFRKLQKYISYEPSRGTLNSEYAAVTFPNYSIFVEPALCEFDKERLYQKYKSKLGDALLKTKTNHIKPDFLILKGQHKWIDIPPTSQKIRLKKPRIKFKKEFNRIKPYIKWIIECKNELVTEADISQYLWYAIAYKLPTVLISQLELDDFTSVLKKDIEILKSEGIVCKVMENFRIGEKEKCLDKIKELFI